MDLLKRVAEKKVLLVAHRGVCGGNIPCNFLQVFQAALLAGGHNDDISITEDPEQGWGWLADRGFDLIQTDFVFQCRQFLEDTGRRNK